MNESVAVVTGSTSGIGLGIAEAFASTGCHLVVNGIATAGEVEALTARLRKRHGVEVLFHPANLADANQCMALIHDAEAHFGAIDILVNNAGIQHVAPLESFPVERWDAVIAVNLSSAFHTIRTVLPGMRRRNRGRIVNIASVHGLVASVHKAAYVAAKHGLVGLTKVVALETAESGITCNAICPGWVLTTLVEKQIDDRAAYRNLAVEEAAREILHEKQPSGRFVTVEEIAGLTQFLCSPSAASITGACFPIDGGWTAR